MGEIVFVKTGSLSRHLLLTSEHPEENVNEGMLNAESTNGFANWVDVATFVDEALWWDEVSSSPTPT